MNPQSLLEQFLGPQAGRSAGGMVDSAKERLAGSGMGGVAGGLAAGGVLGLLIGSKKARKTVGKLAGGAVGYGGAAVLGALAFKAYQNWQAGKQAPQAGAAPAPATLPGAPPPAGSRFLPETAPANDGRPFELALVLAMIAAANADGHIGPEEQKTIFDKVGQLPLDAEAKGFVFDALAKPPSLQDIAGLAQGPEQAAELWLASRIAIDPDHPMEQAYLEALAGRLALPAELVQHLEGQAAAAMA
ncbi:tellurite resistance TerB family protein [Pelagibius sp. CAU 1746]|uniref:tellurite resistance TerB family protein n=1 Tax=Pelagibius sp. CAU 1746 TaxID=3140370 RepID=UPI00325ABC9F